MGVGTVAEPVGPSESWQTAAAATCKLSEGQHAVHTLLVYPVESTSRPVTRDHALRNRRKTYNSPAITRDEINAIPGVGSVWMRKRMRPK